MKILVTGANGFLGRGIVKELTKFNIDVCATGRNVDEIDCDVEKLAVDLFSVENPFEYFGRPDILLHLAWKDGFNHNSVSHITNLNSHIQFIEKMISSGLKKVSIMGSVHEVGFYEGSVDENTKCEPQSFYGIAKNALRQYSYLLAKNNNTIWQWLRGFYIVSNDSYGNSIFCKIVNAEKNGDKIFPFTMGLNQFDFIDYEDFCYLTVKAVLQDKINGIINICNGRPEKLSDRVEKFIKENGFNIKLNYGSFPDRPYDSKAIWGNDYKIKLILDNPNI